MRSNYNSTKLCFVYFGFSPGKFPDKTNALIRLYRRFPWATSPNSSRSKFSSEIENVAAPFREPRLQPQWASASARCSISSKLGWALRIQLRASLTSFSFTGIARGISSALATIFPPNFTGFARLIENFQ